MLPVATQVVRALGGRNGRARCPVHEGKSMSLSISEGVDGRLLYHCFGGCDPGAVRDALAARGLIQDRRRRVIEPRRIAPAVIEATPAPKRWSLEAEGIWRCTTPIAGSIVETYLRARGCYVPDAHDLRFGTWGGYHYPAMVARVTDAETGAPKSLHYTLLRRDGRGKADDIDPVKRLLKGHQKKGGVIRLCDDADVTTALGLAEGVETALSVIANGWRPVWATIDAGNMADFPVLPSIERLTLFADADRAGFDAALGCGLRYFRAERDFRIISPPAGDWNDPQVAGPREAADREWSVADDQAQEVA